VFLRHQSFKLNQQPVTRRRGRGRAHVRAACAGAAPAPCTCAGATEYWSGALCDESVLIITLVRGTSRDAFADTYDKLSVYQQISFPNPAIFPLVYPRPSAEKYRYAVRRDRADVAVFPSFRLCTSTCVYPAAVAAAGGGRGRGCRVHKSAMTAEGRAFLPNKLGGRNRNVGINEFIRSLSATARGLATCRDKDLFISKSAGYLAPVNRASARQVPLLHRNRADTRWTEHANRCESSFYRSLGEVCRSFVFLFTARSRI